MTSEIIASLILGLLLAPLQSLLAKLLRVLAWIVEPDCPGIFCES